MRDRVFGFVLGTGRCGSTLVEEIVARHRDVGFLSNVDDRVGAFPVAGRWNGALYRRLPPSWTEKGRIRFAPTEGYRVLERNVSPVLAMPPHDLTAADATPSLAARFRTFFEHRAAAQGAPVFLHKFTGWPRAGFVAASLTGTRFVHVVRDGRAVASSWLRMPWWRGNQGPEGWHFGPLPEAYAEEWAASGRSQVVLAGLAWKLLLDAFDVAQAATSDRPWLVLRYEDVVAEPESTMRVLLQFLGLDWDDYFASQLGRFAFDAGRLDAYRHELSPADVALLEQTLAGHLDRYGYQVVG
ncbi:MAG TPA: sulfotransferase [Acidimicrobiales bacterium]|nr:sulfotransferase [Acidimicrobiales bacterium]